MVPDCTFLLGSTSADMWAGALWTSGSWKLQWATVVLKGGSLQLDSGGERSCLEDNSVPPAILEGQYFEWVKEFWAQPWAGLEEGVGGVPWGSGGDGLCGRSLPFFQIVKFLNKRPFSFFTRPLLPEFPCGLQAAEPHFCSVTVTLGVFYFFLRFN